MKIRINSQELNGLQKEIVRRYFPEDLCVSFPDGLKLRPTCLVLSPEFVMDKAMYEARLNYPVTPEAEYYEIEVWKENMEAVDKHLENFDKKRKKLQFVHYSCDAQKDVPTKDPLENVYTEVDPWQTFDNV